VASLKSQGIVKVFSMKKDTYVWHTVHEQQIRQELTKVVRKYHEKYPYRYGMKKAEVHMTYMKKVKLNVFDSYMDLLEREQVLSRYQEYLKLPEFVVKKDDIYEKVQKTVEKVFQKAQFDFVRFSEISFAGIEQEVVEDILLLLMDEEYVVKIAEDIYTLKTIIEQAKEVIIARLQENPLITIAEVRDLLGTSRKSAKPILEYMDSIKVTKKNGTESERVAYI
jgi:selenocysteine-specific elongation factor